MTFVLRSGRHLRAVLLSLALVVSLVSLVGLAAGPANANTARPRELASASPTTGVVLSWKPVRKATSYAVQVSTDKTFASITWSLNTVNTRATPGITLPLGKLFWRVQAFGPNGASNWSSASFTRTKQPGPALVGPEDGAQLDQPEDPPVLRWSPVAGAVSYVVEVDQATDEPDWVDSVTASVKTTSYAVVDPVPDGTYWWRVRAVFDNGINTNPSDVRSYHVGPLQSVVMHTTGDQMEDVVLSWDPVPGAVTYELRVSTDNSFPDSNITEQVIVLGTFYSPPQTYNNASYFWQVRARNVLHQSEAWPQFPDETGVFQRYWPEKPTLTYPTDGQTVGAEDPWFQWTPVPLASSYILDWGSDEGFSPGMFTSCVTTQTTLSLGHLKGKPGAAACGPTGPGTYYWRVRAIDAPRNVQGIISDVHSFTWAHTYPAGENIPMTAVTGQRVVLDGTSSGTAHQCTDALADGAICENVSATPTLDWDPVPGAAYYLVYLSHDAEFTNLLYNGIAADPRTLPATANTRWTPNAALPDTQAGQAYYWYIRACNSAGLCGLTPTQASNAFQKKSPPVALVSPADQATVADEVTFDWTDYLATNAATTDPSTGEHPGQAGRQYHVEVSTTPTFADLVDERTVDQSTYTAYARIYPEGVLYWRVQVIDGSNNPLTWSPTRKFTMASPAPTPISPVDNAVVSGVQPFRWEPLNFAAFYDVEIYSNNDTTASSANKKAYGYNLRQTAFTAPGTLPASAEPYVWRVRRTNIDKHVGPWSGWRRFTVLGTAAAMVKPTAGAVVPAARSLFTWRSVAQAASYQLELRNTRADLLYRYPTVGLAYAPPSALPHGRWAWRVVSLDADEELLKASAWRKFRVKG